MRILIVGCGYVGTEAGRILAAAGHEVYGTRRSAEQEAELVDAGIKPLVADLADPRTFGVFPDRLEGVVHCASSSKGGAEAYRTVFVEGMRALREWMRGQPVRKFVYTSSTSVYGQTDGSLVKEESPVEPLGETGHLLLEAEKLAVGGANPSVCSSVVLRLAGIYGPDRGHLFQQYLNNEAVIQGDGLRWINMIHRDDAAGAIVAALRDGRGGQIYNVVDDEPVTQLNFFRWLSETLGKWMPPAGGEASSSPRKRALTHKRVSNRKLKMELGYKLKYPTFRQGYTEEIRRLDNAGKLKIDPEPR